MTSERAKCRGLKRRATLGPLHWFGIAIIIAVTLSSISAVADGKKARGALVSVTFSGTVGVRLTELPHQHDFRARVACHLIAQPKSFWRHKAALQAQLTTYRQVFRQDFYEEKKQLTLPPEKLWKIKIVGDAKRMFFPGRPDNQNHDYVAVKYKFHSVLFGSKSSLGDSEPALKKVGGEWSDTWNLPIDPELLFQRTGHACMDEEEFPVATVDSENVHTYYDDTCEAEEPMLVYNASESRCHYTEFPELSCIEALTLNVGMTTVNITWKRIPWDADKADKWRVGKPTSPTADMEGLAENLHDNRLAYLYFPEGSCSLQEGKVTHKCNTPLPKKATGCISAKGWRRVLRFTATDINVGKTDLVIGDPSTPVFLENNIFTYDPCHQHYHFEHYGTFMLGTRKARKTGFCLQSTWRYYNNEYTPFGNDFSTCKYQGIASGWGDDYNAGLPCQWVDVTDMAATTTNLSMALNPDGFLCEGKPDLNSDGSPKFVPTDFCTPSGQRVSRQKCNMTPNYDENNKHSISYKLPDKVSMVTQPCKRWMVGPLRDCGFTVHTDIATCQPGKKIELHFKIKNPQAPVAVRICESSYALRSSTACEYADAVATGTLMDYRSKLTFTCPVARDAVERGGLFSILVAPNLIEDDLQPVKVKVNK